MLSQAEKYSSFKKTSGPPYYHFSPRYVPLEHNDYLSKKGLGINDVRLFDPRPSLTDTHHH